MIARLSLHHPTNPSATLNPIHRNSGADAYLSALSQVLAVPLLAGSRLGDSRGIKLVTWFSAVGAILGVSLLEQSGSAPGIGDVWSLASALFFGIQVCAGTIDGSSRAIFVVFHIYRQL